MAKENNHYKFSFFFLTPRSATINAHGTDDKSWTYVNAFQNNFEPHTPSFKKRRRVYTPS